MILIFLLLFSLFLLLFLLVLFVVTLCDLGRFDRNLCVFMRMWLGRIWEWMALTVYVFLFFFFCFIGGNCGRFV